MNYSPEESFPEAIKKEKQFDEFFKNIKAILRQCNVHDTRQAWTSEDQLLDSTLLQKQKSVRDALCDNFNTPKAIQELFELMTQTNKYLSQNPKEIKIPLVRQVSKFVFDILLSFGIYEQGDYPSVTGAGQEGGASYEETITPLMNVLTKYRDQVKNNAGEGGKELFKISD